LLTNKAYPPTQNLHLINYLWTFFYDSVSGLGYSGRIFVNGEESGAVGHDSARFVAGTSDFLTQDEESSGIIDVSAILGEGWDLLVQQTHYATNAELVEGGQLLALHIPPGKNFK
jgi:hypothetical protein